MPSKWSGRLRGAETAASRIASQDAVAENNARFDAEQARITERTAVTDARYAAETARVADRTAVTDKRYEAETARTTGRDAVGDKRYADEQAHQTGREKVTDTRYKEDRLWQRAAETRRQDREEANAEQARQTFDQAHEAADMSLKEEKAAAMYNGSTQFIYGATRGYPHDVVVRAHNLTLEEGMPKMTDFAIDDDGGVVSMYEDGKSRKTPAEKVQAITTHFENAGRTSKSGRSTRTTSGSDDTDTDVKGIEGRIKALREDILDILDARSNKKPTEADKAHLARLRARLGDYERILDTHFGLEGESAEPAATPFDAAAAGITVFKGGK